MARDNKNNPRNPASPLFKRLTRLLSGPVVNYRTQVARQERLTIFYILLTFHNHCISHPAPNSKRHC